MLHVIMTCVSDDSVVYAQVNLQNKEKYEKGQGI